MMLLLRRTLHRLDTLLSCYRGDEIINRNELNMFPQEIITKSHKHSIHHKDEVFKSDIYGCFYCVSTFQPIEIVEWIDEDDTAICPNCGIDSVIGNNSGYPVSDISYLKEMHNYWF